MTRTLLYVLDHVVPVAEALLPPAMRTPAARAMLLAIGLQESSFEARRQLPTGPARGFWQFERGGVAGVLGHPASRPHLERVLRTLGYPADPWAVHQALEHHDVLACVCARLLLWTHPAALPSEHLYDVAWSQYLATWRPGKPRPATWRGYYGVAWDLVTVDHKELEPCED
jgi:hypothetical protein